MGTKIQAAAVRCKSLAEYLYRHREEIALEQLAKAAVDAEGAESKIRTAVKVARAVVNLLT